MADPFTFDDEEEDNVVVDLVDSEGETPDIPLNYDEDDPNLCFAFEGNQTGKDYLGEVADDIVRKFDDAWEKSTKHRKNFVDIWKFYGGDLPEKIWPFENSANANIPILMENTTRLVARITGEIFGDFKSFMTVIPVGSDDEERARILTKFDRWQFNEQIPDFRRQMRRLVTLFFLGGDVTVHSFYDPEREENRHEILTPNEFVVPQTDKSTMPDYSDVPWRAKIMPYQVHQLQKMRHKWANVDDIIEDYRPEDDDRPEDELDREVRRISGLDNSDETDAPYQLIQWEGWADLPGKKDQRFLQVILDYNTRHVLSLRIHEEPRWQDQQRYDQQIGELASYRSEQQTQVEGNAEIDEANAQLSQAMATGAVDPEKAVETSESMEGNRPEAPVPPKWMQEPEDMEELPAPVKKDQINMFYHLVCLEPLRGILGVNYGLTQAQFNKAVDILFSQMVDSATLGNVKSFLTSGNVEFPEGFTIQPGKFTKMKGVMPGELDKSIKELNLGAANPQMKEAMEMIVKWAQTSMQSPDVLSGAPGKSGETFRGLSSRIEQASTQISMFGMQIIEAVEWIMKKNAHLNSIYLPDEQIVQVMNEKLGQVEELMMGRKLYEKGYHVTFSADSRFISKSQRVAEADELLTMFLTFPQLQGNMELLTKLFEKALKARDLDHLIRFFAPGPPPLPEEPKGTSPTPTQGNAAPDMGPTPPRPPQPPS